MQEHNPFMNGKHAARAFFELDCGAGLNLLRASDSGRDARTFEFGSERGILILLQYRGSAQVQVGDGERLSRGEDGKLWIVNLQQGCRLAMAPGAAYVLLKIALSALEGVATGRGVPVHAICAHGEHPSDPVLEHFVDALSEHAAAMPPDMGVDRHFCRAIATAIEHHVLRTYAGAGTRLADTGGALAPWQLQTVKEAILANLDTKLPACELARMCGISTSHFRRAFFSSTGMSLHRWVIRQRVEQVCGDLLGSSLPMADIALRWGFSDQSHLSRTFVAVLGITPARWRKTRTGQTLFLPKTRPQRSRCQGQMMQMSG
jgi:AraC-like DNA-binding protein